MQTDIDFGGSMTATTFALTALDTGRLVAAAVVCVEARYCSVLRAGADRIDRRFVPATDWPPLTQELAALDRGPVAARTILARAICGDEARSVILQYLSKRPVTAGPLDAASVLDALLRGTVAPLSNTPA